MRLLLVLILWQPVSAVHAQLTGKITLEQFGVEFTIPEGWVGQPTESGYILGSQTEAGAIFLSSHQSASLEALRKEAMEGIFEAGGTQLSLESPPEDISENSIGGTYRGTLQGTPVRGYAVGLINPYGRGVTVLAVTTPQMFTQRHQQLAKQIAAGLRFFKSAAAPIVGEWKKALTNVRLTYMESYQSNGDGYSDKIVIDLCEGGYFRHSKNYSLGIDTGGAFASDNSAAQGAGTWEIIPDASGNAILELTFRQGTVQEYTLQYANEKTLLNGKRYFRTNDANCR